MNLPESMTYIDNDFYRLSSADAKKVAGGKLPKPGQESLVVFDNKRWFLTLTKVWGEMAWSVRLTDWRFEDNRLILRSPLDMSFAVSGAVFDFIKARAAGTTRLKDTEAL